MFLICLIYVYVSIIYQYLCASIYKKNYQLEMISIFIFIFQTSNRISREENYTS